MIKSKDIFLKEIENKANIFVHLWAEYLLSQQIIFDEDIDSLDELKDVIALRNGRKFDATSINQNEKYPDLWKIGLINDIVTSNEQNELIINYRRKLKTNRSLLSKISRHVNFNSFETIYKVLGFFKWKIVGILFYGRVKNLNVDIKWAQVRGVNFVKMSNGKFRCIDHGAIYEDYLTTNATRYPSQIGADLYTTSCAAAIFHKMSKKTREAKWESGLQSAKIYYERYDHVRQRLETDHSEFNFAPVSVAFEDDTKSNFDLWCDYSPVNVFALRWLNVAFGSRKSSVIEKSLIKQVLRANQTHDGLIQDNFSGRLINCNDITYHNYALACLAIGNAYLKDETINKILTRGLNYSISLQLATGQVAYYGRAANNIYHVASFISALLATNPRESRDALNAINLSLDYLLSFCNDQMKDPPAPACLNHHEFTQLDGWHGSCAQYGALSSFLILQSLEILGENEHFEQINFSNRNVENRITENCLISNLEQKLSNLISVGLTSGGSKNEWNNNRYVTGFSGMTAMVIAGKNRLLTNTLQIDKEGNKQSCFDVDDVVGDTRNLLFRVKKQKARLELRKRGKVLCYDYECKSDSFEVNIKSNVSFISYKIPLANVKSWKLISKNKIRINFLDDTIVSCTFDSDVSVRCECVKSNPQGPGVLFYIEVQRSSLSVNFSLVEVIG